MTEVERQCPRCGDTQPPHPWPRCPYVKAIEFVDGNPELIGRIEFLTPADYGRRSSAEEPAPENYPRMGGSSEA